jgi:hypothetical protein
VNVHAPPYAEHDSSMGAPAGRESPRLYILGIGLVVSTL